MYENSSQVPRDGPACPAAGISMMVVNRERLRLTPAIECRDAPSATYFGSSECIVLFLLSGDAR